MSGAAEKCTARVVPLAIAGSATRL